jgi:hypothetical protein
MRLIYTDEARLEMIDAGATTAASTKSWRRSSSNVWLPLLRPSSAIPKHGAALMKNMPQAHQSVPLRGDLSSACD